jgi:signal transduction histidine kinase
MRFSLSKKLFVFICTILILTILPLFYIADTALTRFGSYSVLVNKDQITNISHHYLSRVADETAQKHNEIFKRIKTTSSFMANQVTSVYNNIAMIPEKPLPASNLTWQQENQMFFSPREEDVITAYWGDDKISDKIQIELNALSHLEPALIKSKELIKESLATHIITDTGIGIYYTSDINAKKSCYELPPPSEFDMRDGEPVTVFTKQDTKLYDTQWTSIYKDDVIEGLMMTATTPIYDQTGQFKGVTGIDIPVEHIIESLIGNPFLSDNTNDDNSFAFLQNKKGHLIAFPKRFFTLFGLDIDFDQFENSDDIFKYRLEDSSIESIRKVASKIYTNPQGIIELMIKNEKYLLATSYLRSVHWKVVLVVKETDILASVQKTALALKKEQKNIWNDFIFLSLLILFIAIASIVYAIKLFISPIKEFIETIQKAARGNFSHTIKISRSDEIGSLSKSLNSMVDELITSKQTVEQKTIQLKSLNEHLLNAGELERKSIASDLHDSVAQTLAFSITGLKNMKNSDLSISRENITAIEDQLEQATAEIRSIIYQLRPPIIDDFEIDIALDYLIDGYNENHDCRVAFANKSNDFLKTSQDVRLTLYRAANELIINILKHAKTRKVELELSNTKDSILLTVEDRGVGFDLNKIKKPNLNSFGLYSLSERITNLGGFFEILSKPGKGTKALISIPFTSKQDI